MTDVLTCSRWMEDLRGVIAALEQLNRATENDFTAVGGNLMAFFSDSRRLGDEIAGLTTLASGEQAQNACESLVAVRRYVQVMRRRSEEEGHALQILQTGADRIRRNFSTFGMIVLSFRMTAIAAKMEVAQITTSQQNLASLAEDVRSCIEGMSQRATQILDVATDFDSRIASTLSEVSRFNAIQLQELPSLLAAVDADIDAFQARQRQAAKASLKLAADLESVTRDLGSIATALQFHDITRQQVEHVIGTLACLLRDAPDGAISFSGGALARLQKAQLQSAATAFANSSAKIVRDLEAVEARVEEMAAGSNRIQDGGGRHSIAGGIENRFAEIARAVGELQSLEQGVRGIVTGLQKARLDLGIAVNEVQSVELQLSYISINASASALRLGQQGAVLKVIAAAIGELRMASAARSNDAGTALNSIGEAILSLAGSSLEANDHPGATLVTDIDMRARELQSVGASGVHAAAKVVTLAENLRANLQSAREQFGVGRQFADTVSRCSALLDGIAAQAPASGESGATEALDALYTMETQRDVHRALTNGSNGRPSEEPSCALAVESGDDVEFF